MRFQFVLLTVVALGSPSIHGAEKNNKMPPDLDAALLSASKSILYSLEPITEPNPPGPKLQGFKILGKMKLDQSQTALAVNAFKMAISDWDGVSMACFDPRQALRITKDGQTYDLLVCYACHNLYVYRGNKLFASFGAAGSPQKLNGILTAAKIPLSATH